jgi:hypothetical protein
MEGGQYTWIHYTLMWRINTRIMPMSTRDASFTLIEKQVNEKGIGHLLWNMYSDLLYTSQRIWIIFYRATRLGVRHPCRWTIFDVSLPPWWLGICLLYTFAVPLDKYSFWRGYCGKYYAWNDLGHCPLVGSLWHIKVKSNYDNGCPPTRSSILDYY